MTKLYAVSASRPHDFTSDLSEAERLSQFANKAAHYREDDGSIRAAFGSKEDALAMREVLRDFGASAGVFEAEAHATEPASYAWHSDEGAYIVEGREITA